MRKFLLATLCSLTISVAGVGGWLTNTLVYSKAEKKHGIALVEETYEFPKVEKFTRGICRIYENPPDPKKGEKIERPTSATGFFFEKTDTHYLIMTNAHCVDREGEVWIDVWKNNVVTRIKKSRVRWRYFEGPHKDLAVIEVKKEKLPFKPTIFPLAPQNHKLKKGFPIYSVGLPRGQWPMFWYSYIIDSKENKFFKTRHNAIPGQSGSPVFQNIDGEPHVVGVVDMMTNTTRIMIGGNPYPGFAIHINNIHNVLKAQRKNDNNNLEEPE